MLGSDAGKVLEDNLDTWISRDARSTGSGGFFGDAFWPLGNAEEVSASRAAAPLSTRWSEWSSPSEIKRRPRGSRRSGVDLTREREMHRCPRSECRSVGRHCFSHNSRDARHAEGRVAGRKHEASAGE